MEKNTEKDAALKDITGRIAALFIKTGIDTRPTADIEKDAEKCILSYDWSGLGLMLELIKLSPYNDIDASSDDIDAAQDLDYDIQDYVFQYIEIPENW